uniref:Uncharacterized protein n=1 Tax=Syphacia muris TaxID=451379 RepID=A0A0N5AWY0_9BILA
MDEQQQQRQQSYYPLPTQFLQPEASEDEDEDVRYEDDDDEYEQPLIQIKMNNQAAGNSVPLPECSGIAPSVFYGVAETSQQAEMRSSDDQSEHYMQQDQNYVVPSATVYRENSDNINALSSQDDYANTGASASSCNSLRYSSDVISSQQQQCRSYPQQQLVSDTSIIVNDTNRVQFFLPLGI